jgi:hypothetical protein
LGQIPKTSSPSYLGPHSLFLINKIAFLIDVIRQKLAQQLIASFSLPPPLKIIFRSKVNLPLFIIPASKQPGSFSPYSSSAVGEPSLLLSKPSSPLRERDDSTCTTIGGAKPMWVENPKDLLEIDIYLYIFSSKNIYTFIMGIKMRFISTFLPPK